MPNSKKYSKIYFYTQYNKRDLLKHIGGSYYLLIPKQVPEDLEKEYYKVKIFSEEREKIVIIIQKVDDI